MKILQSSALRALVAVVVGLVLIVYRKSALEWMVILVGALFFLSGCFSCFAYYWEKRKAERSVEAVGEEGKTVKPLIPSFPIVGIGSVLLGVILMCMRGAFIKGVAFGLAGILILGAIKQFVSLGAARRYARIPLIYWLLPFITLGIGTVILLKPIETMASPLLVIGWCMVFYGVSEALNSLKIYQLQKQYYRAEQQSVVVGKLQQSDDSDIEEAEQME